MAPASSSSAFGLGRGKKKELLLAQLSDWNKDAAPSTELRKCASSGLLRISSTWLLAALPDLATHARILLSQGDLLFCASGFLPKQITPAGCWRLHLARPSTSHAAAATSGIIMRASHFFCTQVLQPRRDQVGGVRAQIHRRRAAWWASLPQPTR